jgi:AraC family transcriptional regulator, carnitine catabolism transcriptional activator
MKDLITVGLFLPPGFGLPAFASLNDLFYLLNRERKDAPAISWKAISPDGMTACSSSGRIVKTDVSTAADVTYDLIIVVSAVSNHFDKASAAWLRKQARFGATLGAVTSGLWLLAHAGVIGNRRCTLHWADLEAFRQHFPEINVTADIFAIEDGLITCAGLGAVHDMMFAYLADRFDKRALDAVMERLIIDRLRRPHEAQRLAPVARFQGANRLLTMAVNRVESAITERNVVETVSRELDVSRRWLQILFKRGTGMTMKEYQTSCRIERACQLLSATSLPISEIALMTGFSDGAHLSNSFSHALGVAPARYRKNASA